MVPVLVVVLDAIALILARSARGGLCVHEEQDVGHVYVRTQVLARLSFEEARDHVSGATVRHEVREGVDIPPLDHHLLGGRLHVLAVEADIDVERLICLTLGHDGSEEGLLMLLTSKGVRNRQFIVLSKGQFVVEHCCLIDNHLEFLGLNRLSVVRHRI